jgi:hypothetical protein
MGDSPCANVVEGEGVSLCPSLRFSPRFGSDLGSEALGVESVRAAAESWPRGRSHRGRRNHFRRGFCSFLVLLALPELMVEETWYVTLTLTQEIGKRIAGIHSVGQP